MSRFLPPLIAIAALVGGVMLAIIYIQPPASDRPALSGGVLLDQPRPIRDFALIDHDGESFDQQRLQGRWTAIFPGFTHCPDICPTTLGVLRTAHAELEDQAEEWDIVFLSVDPERDRPESLRQYVGYFSQAFTGVTGDKDVIGRLAADLSVAYQYTPNKDGGYTVDHTAAIVLIDPQGRVAGYLQPPFRPDQLATDLRTTAASRS